MNDIYITLTGNVAAEPRQYTFEDGAKVTSLRVLTSHRYFDRKTGQWTDGERVCFAVRCWRSLGDNVAQSIKIGQPVVVSGKLRIREFGPEGDRRFMPEIEASAVGHDLRWGTGAFVKPERGGGAATVSKEMRDRLDAETQDWAMGMSAGMSAGMGTSTGTGMGTSAGTGMSGRTDHARPSLPEPPAFTPLPLAPADDAGEAAYASNQRDLAPATRAGEPRHAADQAESHHLHTMGKASDTGDGADALRADDTAASNVQRPKTSPAPTSPASGKAPSKPSRSKGRPARTDGTVIRILGEDDNEHEAEDAEWPTREPIAA
ncbi:single-stranded DNA-binding protein [Nonomuraea sp. 3-1Str]|uniref:single-stranded DNA-binding protein n=1 Tax=Nonomuraea sp. 3-1Str TaxID=2929801 RepID=UPI00285D3686|nr:single-stranded DNA-binding protein [Nonomuraea sp. 3-1Str]MDR8412108.1 single-stranded DNA-binding protein [Nonomuraea sp. 3-1Str]